MELSCYGKALTLFVRGDTKLKMQKDTVEVEHLYLNKKYESQAPRYVSTHLPLWRAISAGLERDFRNSRKSLFSE